MPSKKIVEPLDTLEQDVPTTPADIEALERIRLEHNRMDPQQYLEFLHTFIDRHPAGRETNSENDEPFVLPD